MDSVIDRPLKVTFTGFADVNTYREMSDFQVDGPDQVWNVIHYDGDVFLRGEDRPTPPADVVDAVKRHIEEENDRRTRARAEEVAAKKAERIASLKAEAAEYGVSVDTLLIVEALDSLAMRLRSFEETVAPL